MLPFVNVGGDIDQEYFADGLTDELISALARIEGLHVVARTSAFKFKGRNDDLRDVGRRLGVSTALEGDVRAARGRLRITVRLISTRDGFPLWSETYEREMEDIFLVQEQIARAIVMTLRPQFENVSNRRFSTEYSHSVEAYRTYLKGRYLQHKWGGDRLLESLGYFQTALHLDPGFAPALVDLPSRI